MRKRVSLDDDRCRKRSAATSRFYFHLLFYRELQAACISPSFVLERLRSSGEKASLDLAFDLRDRQAASLETDVSIAVSRDCRYRKPGEVLLIHLAKKKCFCARGRFLPSSVSTTLLPREGNPDWRTPAMGILCVAKSFAKTDVPYLYNR